MSSPRGPRLGRSTEAAHDLSWMAKAECAGQDEEKGAPVFFPGRVGGGVRGEGGEVVHPEEVRAKALCGACVVREECLSYALAKPERFGIWGGLNTYERDQLRKKMS